MKVFIRVIIMSVLFSSFRVYAEEPFATPEKASLFSREEGQIYISRRPRLDETGEIVVFESTLVYKKNKRLKKKGIYLYERSVRTMTEIEGPYAHFIKGEPFISLNGRMVAYQAYHENPDPKLPPALADIVLWDREIGKHTVVTRGINQPEHDGECSAPMLDSQGQQLVFSCNATNMHVDQTISLPQVFYKNMAASEFQLISKSSSGVVGNRISGDAKLSDDGRWIFFKSASTNLIDGLAPSSLSFHLYMADRHSGKLVRVNQNTSGIDFSKINLGSYDISKWGEFVVFQGRLQGGKDPVAHLERSHIYLYERERAQLRKLSTGGFSERAHDPAISADGRFVAFVFKGADVPASDRAVYVMDLKSGKSKPIFKGACYSPQFSGNGKVIGFESMIRTGPNKPDILEILLLPNPFNE